MQSYFFIKKIIYFLIFRFPWVWLLWARLISIICLTWRIVTLGTYSTISCTPRIDPNTRIAIRTSNTKIAILTLWWRIVTPILYRSRSGLCCKGAGVYLGARGGSKKTSLETPVSEVLRYIRRKKIRRIIIFGGLKYSEGKNIRRIKIFGGKKLKGLSA